MKKIISVTAAVMLLSLPVFANGPSKFPSDVKTEESTKTKSSTTTLPSGEKMHQDSTTVDSTKIEAQEDSSMMDSDLHDHKKSSAPNQPMELDQE